MLCFNKYFRLAMGYNWYENEQPNAATKSRVKEVLNNMNNKIDIILTKIKKIKNAVQANPSNSQIRTSQIYDLWWI